ncbi:MAG: 2-succinyl-5-enolpyruvyl-6-hydroxy-3-cyclohexene-1-carboxylic-acid synthase [Dermatophilaceae bacterium]
MTISAHERAVSVVRSLRAAGVGDLVLAPGSRSAPLALAAFAADRAGDLRMHVRIDERTAGFLALGLSIGSRRPVAVVTTSGTAVGNLLPAVMEAHHSGRRLVVVTADRPPSLRGTGANQTTWQPGIFGRFARSVELPLTATAQEADALMADLLSSGGFPGPVHLNLPFDAPLLPEPGSPWWPQSPREGACDVDDREGDADTAYPLGRAQPSTPGVVLETGPRTVVLAGDDAGPRARLLAERAGWPLLAEPTSGARVGAQAIRTYRLLLSGPLGREIERVVVMGHPTLSRPQTALLTRPDITLVAVRGPGGIATDPARTATVLDEPPTVAERAPHPEDLAWVARWQAADRRLGDALDGLVAGLPELDALQVADAVAGAATPGTTLVVGSSNPIRDLDLMMRPGQPHERRFVVGNRGLAGIDGTLSTAIGVALGRPARSIALVGDVTFVHDLTGLVLGPDEPRPDLTIVVVNDDGGSIFSLLEQGATDYAEAFERVFATPHGVDVAAVCAATGTAYRLVTTRADLRAALSDITPGVRVVEAKVSRADRRRTAAAIAALGQDGPMPGDRS